MERIAIDVMGPLPLSESTFWSSQTTSPSGKKLMPCRIRKLRLWPGLCMQHYFLRASYKLHRDIYKVVFKPVSPLPVSFTSAISIIVSAQEKVLRTMR